MSRVGPVHPEKPYLVVFTRCASAIFWRLYLFVCVIYYEGIAKASC